MPDASKKSACKTAKVEDLIDLGREILYEMSQCQSPRYGDVLHQLRFLLTFIFSSNIISETSSKTFLFVLKCHKMANAPIEGLAMPLAKKLENFMTKAKSKMSVKFFNDVAQRFPGYLIGELEKLCDLSITAVNGYRKSVASDLMLKVVKSGKIAGIDRK